MIEIFNLYMNNYYEKYKLFLNTFVIVTIIYIILESVIIPVLIGNLITNINSPKKYLYYILFVYTLILVLYYIKKRFESKLFPDLLTYSRTLFFSNLIDKYSENYKSLKMGSNVSRINLITYIFREYSTYLVDSIIPFSLISLFISFTLIYLNFNLGLITLFSLILFYITIFLYKDTMFQKIKYISDSYYKMDNDYIDIFSSLMNTYLNNNEVKEKEKIQNSQSIYNVLLNDYQIINTKLFVSLYFIGVLTSFISIIYITIFTKDKNKIIILILLIYFINSLLILSKNIPQTLNQYAITKESNGYVKNLLNIHSNNLQKEIKSGKIELKNLTFGYKKNHIILKNINLIIKDKDKVAIIGRSGSGKSTLSKVLLKFYKYQGEILIDDKNIKDINTKYLRTKILYGNQKTILYDMTVIDNIKYGNNSQSEYILKLLNDYELLDIFSGLKNGIYSESGVQGNELSGGMQKIVIILRTILKSEDTKSFIVILDEPLAGLDSKTRKKVIKLINDKFSDTTLIIITHDKEILPYMNRIIDLSEINNTINKSKKIRNFKNYS